MYPAISKGNGQVTVNGEGTASIVSGCVISDATALKGNVVSVRIPYILKSVEFNRNAVWRAVEIIARETIVLDKEPDSICHAFRSG